MYYPTIIDEDKCDGDIIEEIDIGASYCGCTVIRQDRDEVFVTAKQLIVLIEALQRCVNQAS